jgi:hypothetical protein
LALDVVIITPKYKFPTPELKTRTQEGASITKARELVLNTAASSGVYVRIK